MIGALICVALVFGIALMFRRLDRASGGSLGVIVVIALLLMGGSLFWQVRTNGPGIPIGATAVCDYEGHNISVFDNGRIATLNTRTYWYIVSVTSGSPASRSGLKPGDIVIGEMNVDRDDLYWDDNADREAKHSNVPGIGVLRLKKHGDTHCTLKGYFMYGGIGARTAWTMDVR